jgi:alpha-mannosidase
MLPDTLPYAGIRFKLIPAGNQPNALVSRGQTIKLPQGNYTRLYILAASVDGDQSATFRVNNRPVELMIQDWGGFIGQWDNRQWEAKEVQLQNSSDSSASKTRTDPYAVMTGIKPGFIKRAPLAWFASHNHGSNGRSEAYSYSYLFAHTIELPPSVKTLTLPRNDRVRIIAMTVSDEKEQVRPAHPLYDTLERERE